MQPSPANSWMCLKNNHSTGSSQCSGSDISSSSLPSSPAASEGGQQGSNKAANEALAAQERVRQSTEFVERRCQEVRRRQWEEEQQRQEVAERNRRHHMEVERRREEQYQLRARNRRLQLETNDRRREAAACRRQANDGWSRRTNYDHLRQHSRHAAADGRRDLPRQPYSTRPHRGGRKWQQRQGRKVAKAAARQGPQGPMESVMAAVLPSGSRPAAVHIHMGQSNVYHK